MAVSIDILHLQDKENDSFEYWNDENLEKGKKFYNIIKDFDTFKKNEKQNILSNETSRIIDQNNINLKNKNILSIGSGTCYIEARTFKIHDFNKLTCLDFSNHRITQMAPIVFDKFNLSNKSIQLICGNPDEYFIKYRNDKFDLIFMCQALHHFANPEKLMSSLKKNLNNNGRIVIIGEPYYNMLERIILKFKNILKYLINYKNFRSYYTMNELFSGIILKDKIKGDHHRSLRSYKNLFYKYNLNIESIKILKSQKKISFFEKNKTISFCLKYNV